MPVNAADVQEQAIRQFVLDALGLAEATYRFWDERTLEAFVPVKRPPSFFGVEQPPFDRLVLVFGDDPRGLPDGAELVTAGSYRLGWFIDGVRERGRLAIARVPYTLNLSQVQSRIRGARSAGSGPVQWGRFTVTYERHLVVNFKYGVKSDEPFEDVDSLSISLEDGHIRRGIMEALNGWEVQDLRPCPDLQGTIAPGEAAGRLASAVAERVQQEHPHWEVGPQQRFEEEIARLASFFSDRTSQRAEWAEADRLVEELREKFRPRLYVRFINAALILWPAVLLECDALNAAGRLETVKYEPVLDAVSTAEPASARRVRPDGADGVFRGTSPEYRGRTAPGSEP